MAKINQKYSISEITIKVNKRELFYDQMMNRVIYTYNGINKEIFKLSLSKWLGICLKYGFKLTIEKESEILQ